VKSIVDTSVLLGPRVEHLDGELAISAATIAELHFGVLVARNGVARANRLRQLAAFERRFNALPIDSAVASSYGQLAAAVSATGRNPRGRVMDLLIAATAHAHSARLITRNAADLVGLEDLIEIVSV
jgi:predicted nucleic acid-binding protein